MQGQYNDVWLDIFFDNVVLTENPPWIVDRLLLKQVLPAQPVYQPLLPPQLLNAKSHGAW
jgi:hypothetical protein